MARRLVSLVLLATCALALGSGVSPAGASAVHRTASTQALETDVLADMNAVRAAHGLRPLTLSARLSAAARQHTVEMARRGYFEHSSANGTSFDNRIARFYPVGQYRYWAVGENLLYSSPDVDAPDAVKMWMQSPEHRANILRKSWREVGLSAVHSDSAPGEYQGMAVTIITADFGVRR
jgi:uncharacterized protein YkwD